MPVLEAERVTPVSLISLLGSVSHYERSGFLWFIAGRELIQLVASGIVCWDEWVAPICSRTPWPLSSSEFDICC
ncbi:hypothetical protein F511_05518 [Dorcoceras hygrometricum]|uniref:Uncharacterized protein n=1 Tax=Dorcoceras hygrometricum TaxID=472368 RepID=A0A2Z7BA33_9LAMI|nr:hypothetical protein F511_05518 [Dorcoceras hygrometricum]